MKREIIKTGRGIAPAVALINPKYPSNVGKVYRSCSTFGARQLWFTGDRCLEEVERMKRIPREERMRTWGDVDLCHGEYFFDAFGSDVVPIGVEIVRGAQRLSTDFEHPEKPLYVFGPEDGGLEKVHRMHCHQFIVIPTVGQRPLNLAVAAGIVLGMRYMQRVSRGLEDPRASMEPGDHRGFIETDDVPVLSF